jgi:hypothetical protein
MPRKARRGIQSASVGGDIGQWLGNFAQDWLLGWLGFADGGDVKGLGPRPEGVTNKMLSELKADLKAEVEAGNVPIQGASVGGDIGSWVGNFVQDWLSSWFGFSRGGGVRQMARGGMARGGMARGHSVFR